MSIGAPAAEGSRPVVYRHDQQVMRTCNIAQALLSWLARCTHTSLIMLTLALRAVLQAVQQA